METTTQKLHPVLWIAAVAVILLSAAGIGAIFGVIPGVGSATKPAEPVAAAPQEAPGSPPAAQPAAKHKATHAPQTELAQAPAAPPGAQAAPCSNCGVIESVREVEVKGEGTGLGAVAGGVGGALVGSQIGGGRGNTAATVLGAVGGAVAGHQIEKNVRSTKKFQIVVRYDDGHTRTFTQSSMPTWRIGDAVRVENNVIMAR